MSEHHERARFIAGILQRAKLRVSREAVLQEDIRDTLTYHGVDFKLEHALNAADRPDFLSDDVVIEAKCRAGKRLIYRQIERYAAHERVAAIVLVSNTAMGMPPEINGKPVYVVSAGLGHL